jgi:hypothetical protein
VKPKDGLELLEGEILAEKAAALGRIAGKLESSIAALAACRTPEQRRALREEAKRYYWYLVVQREALGFRNHRELELYYRIPSEHELP